jgi:hypothetical protein
MAATRAIPALAVAAVAAWPGTAAGAEGRLTVVPGSAPAASRQTVDFVFEAGPSGLLPGGGFQVELARGGRGPASNPFWDKHQVDDPQGPGYVTAHCEGAASVAVSFGNKRDVGVEVLEGLVLAGERVALRFRGEVPQIAVPLLLHARSRVSGGEEWEALPPERSATFTVTPEEPQLARVVVPADVGAGEEFEIAVVITDRFLNRADYRGTVRFQSTDPAAHLPGAYRFTGSDRGVRRFPARLATPGFHEITIREWSGLQVVPGNPVRVTPGPPTWRHWFGDTHFHTGTGVENMGFVGHHGDHNGNYTRQEDAYAFVRDVMQLDFASASEHDSLAEEREPSMTEAGWLRSQDVATSFNRPGRFTTFYAYEWTSYIPAPGGGQRIVLYDAPGRALYRWSDAGSGSPPGLWARLREQGAPALTVPHVQFSRPDNHVWDHHDPGFERIGEIYSKWNSQGGNDAQSFEAGASRVWTYQHAWARGYRLGVVGASDSHLGQPGLDNLTAWTGHHGGLAVVISESNTRASLWEALRARRTYATTGPRIWLGFLIEGAPMGSEIRHDPSGPGPRGVVLVRGTAPLDRVEVVKYDGERYRTIRLPDDNPDPRGFFFSGRDPSYRGDSFYYVRVFQEDGEMAWSSPVWVDSIREAVGDPERSLGSAPQVHSDLALEDLDR